MVVRNYHVQTIVTRPVERFVRADPAVNTDCQFVAFGDGLLQRGLLNPVTLSETMWHMKSGLRTQQIQRSEENGRPGSAVDVVISVNQDALRTIDCPQ